MFQAKTQFDKNIVRIKEIHDLYNHLKNDLHFNSSFLDDLLRGEIVYAVSGLDKFIHDIVKVGILESYNHLRPTTPSLNNFTFNYAQLKLISSPTPTININNEIEKIIIESHKHLSFQDPEKISSALSLIWLENHKWQKIASAMGMNESNLKIELKNIIIRRNQIVHEGDIDLFSNTIQTINQIDVENSVNFIDSLVNEIYNLVKL
ncbi:HEPN domain-containing protein [Empedobacter stercoris]|uniref:HEPN domain-containing protein n=1 Tax=Empedobacter stercoris TaxID=1628248 RepID=UPI0021AE43E4|nr:HEPN domain-containing protein [Empedobacter stercoris]UWX67237.1 HEPN domain-containing protein [Empedobacter stercoris]